MELAILGAILALPLILAILLRYNIPLAFLSLCAGYVLQSFASVELNTSLDNANVSIADNYVTLAVGTLPFLLTVFLTRKSFSKPFKFIKQIIPLLASGLLLAYITIPYLTGSFNLDYSDIEVWNQIDKYKGAVVAIGILASLAGYWLKSAKSRKLDKKHKHKK